MAPTKALPYCEIAKISPSLEGLVLNYGFAFNERPIEQIHNTEYTFNNFVAEYNTNTIMSKPVLERTFNQDWTINQGDDWKSNWNLFPSVNVMLWSNTDLSATFKITSAHTLEENESFCIEYNKLLSNRQLEDNSYIAIIFGNNQYRIVITKTNISCDIKKGSRWVKNELPLTEKFNFSRQYASQFLYVIPYFDGILISNDLVDYYFVKDEAPLVIHSGKVVIEGKCGVSYFALHKVTFAAANMTSATIYSYIAQQQTNAKIKVGTIPLNANITKSVQVNSNGHDITYSISTQNYMHPVGIAGVCVYFDPVIVRDEITSTVIPNVVSFEETTGWSADELSARIVIDNPYPHNLRGLYKKYNKIQAWIGWQMTDIDNGNVVNTFTTPFLRNVYTIKEVIDETTQSDSKITLVCNSYLQNVIDGMHVVVPDYNGWSIPDILKDILYRAGIPNDRISIADTWNNQTLPLTEENDTWIPEVGAKIWDTLKKIVEEILGGWIIQYPDGKIRIEPYPEIENMTWDNPIATFNADKDLYNIVYTDSDDGNFYNAVSVYGKTKNNIPIGAIMIDEDSLYNPNSNKFLGYLKHWVIIDGAYNTQQLCNTVCTKLFTKVNKFINRIQFTTNVKKGVETIYQGNRIVIQYGSGERIGVLTRGISTTITHNQLQQTIEGEYVVLPQS